MSDQTTIPEAFTDLLDAPFATLATVGADGRPQLSAVGFLHDDGQLKVSLHASGQKTKNLTRNRAVNLFNPRPAKPDAVPRGRGDAELEPDADYALAGRFGRSTAGADLRQMDGGQRASLAVIIRPSCVVAVDLSA